MTDKPRTSLQNRALHKGFEQLADALNDAGYNQSKALEALKLDIPWSKLSVKESLYKPIMEALFQIESTTELSTVELQDVWDVLMVNLGEKLGIYVPFPEDSPGINGLEQYREAR